MLWCSRAQDQGGTNTSVFMAGWGKGRYSKRACLYSPLRPLFFYNHRFFCPRFLKILT